MACVMKLLGDYLIMSGKIIRYMYLLVAYFHFLRSALFVGTSNHQVYALDSLVQEGSLEYEVKCVFVEPTRSFYSEIKEIHC